MLLICIHILFSLVIASSDATHLRNCDHLRLRFLGVPRMWLGCTFSVCDQRDCPYERPEDFNRCTGEVFQIFGQYGSPGDPIRSGQHIMLKWPRAHNIWIGCKNNHRCYKTTCPGSITQARWRFGRCDGENFTIYARGRNNGDIIYNNDEVMLYVNVHRGYVSIQGRFDGDDTSVNYCPGSAPPTTFKYDICPKNTFQIYRLP